MSKSCAKCTKTVYPLEELKCLDKIWHKGCFKCTECGMILNMKTYKGFDKLPYCEAHIPKAKATTVADTPEMKRIQENTKIQSNAAYHAEFEKTKGKFTAVTDDPEMQRLKGNTKIISNVTYHGDLEKKAVMEGQRTLGRDEQGNRNGVQPPSTSPSYMDELSSVPTTQRYGPPPTATYNQPPPPQQHRPAPAGNSYQHSGGEERAQHQSYASPGPPQYTAPPPQQQQHVQHQPSANSASPYSARGAPNVVYSSDVGAVNASPSRKVGSIADFDPVNNYFGSLDQQQQRAQQSGRVGKGAMMPQQQQQPQQQMQNHHRAQVPPPPIDNGYGICYRALYDYEAQDRDEVSFMDGDLITNCTAVDEGWMTGTVQRNGHRGMLPANYVTPTSTN